MLFYEPLFLFIFLPSFYLAYLLGERRAWTRRAVILLASLLFYLWAEPVFGKSNLIYTMVHADGMLHVPLDLAGLYAGDTVVIQLLGTE